ncbi:MAG: hypothetical protein HY905_05860 [Deltaproteobacteria bacterium]|nr:hypothetical protein [Deltaproteobacteria bacterium]
MLHRRWAAGVLVLLSSVWVGCPGGRTAPDDDADDGETDAGDAATDAADDGRRDARDADTDAVDTIGGPCTGDLECQDELFCNGEEMCLAGTGCTAGIRPNCTDDSPCTIDSCDPATDGCVHVPRDFDGDTYVTSAFGCDASGGTDCNDDDPAVNPAATEICDDGRDNDCDTNADYLDETCRPANDTCTAAEPLEDGVILSTSLLGASPHYTLPCWPSTPETGADEVFSFTLGETRDVEVQVVVGRDVAAWVDLERTCGDPASSVRCRGGSATTDFRATSLAPGTYFIVVKSPRATDVMVRYLTSAPTPPPANDTCAGAIDIDPGAGAVTVSLPGAHDDYAPLCGEAGHPDLFYRLVLGEPQAVTLSVSGVPYADAMVASLQGACGDETSDSICVGPAGTVRRAWVDAGTWYVAVDGDVEDPFLLTVRLDPPVAPPPNDTCSGAIDVSGGGAVFGTLLEAYGDHPGWCVTVETVDVVYAFTTAEVRDLSADVSGVASSDSFALDLRSACDDDATTLDCRRGNPAHVTSRSLPAGTYFLIVSGQPVTTGGRFLLELSLAPPSPIPPAAACAAAIDASAGGTFEGSTVGAGDDYQSMCREGSAWDDLVYTLHLATPHDVALDLSTAGIDVALDLRAGSCGTGTDSLGCRAGTVPSLRARSLAPGDYWILVESALPATTTLDVTVGPPTSACDAATDILVSYASGSTFTFTDSGTTAGRPDDFTPGCVSWSSSPDIPYRLVLPARSAVAISVDFTGFDGSLHLRNACDDPASELACNDDCGATSRSCIPDGGTVTLEAGTYTVIVDGYSGGSGPYTLTVTATRL